MPRLTCFLVAALCALSVCGGALWQVSSSRRPLQLKTVRTAVEQGRQVVFFRVVGAGGARIEIADVKLLEDTYGNGRFEKPALSYLVPVNSDTAFHTFDTQKPKGVWFHKVDIWAASSEWPLMDPTKARHEFRLIAPTNGLSWKVRLTVNVETAGFGTRLTKLVHYWRFYRGTGCSMKKAARMAWRSFHQFETRLVESDPFDVNDSFPRLKECVRRPEI